MARGKKNNSNQLIDSMLNAVAIVDADSGNRFIYVNPTWTKLSGYTAEETYKMTPVDFVHPDMQELIAKRLQDRIKGKKVPERYEVKVLNKQNDVVWAEVFVKKIDYGDKPAILIVANDISERKKVETQLNNMRRLLDTAQRMAHLGSLELNIQTGETIWSDELCRILNIKPRSVKHTYKEFLKKIHPDDRKKFQTQCRNAVNKRKFENLEFRIARSDGSYRIIYSIGEMICDETGHPQRLIATLQDITEQKETREDLRFHKTQLSNAINIARLGHWEFDVKNDVFKFNDHFYSIFETSVGKVGSYEMTPEQYAEQFFYPEDRHIVRDEINKAIRSPNPNYKKRLEHRVVKWNGKTGYLSALIFIEKDDKGRTVRTYGVNQDITRHKKIEIEARNNEEKLRSVFRAAPTGIGVVVNRVFTQCNDKICRMTVYSRDELIGKSARMMYPTKKEFEYVGQEKYKQINEKGTGSVETRWKRKDGKIMNVVLSSTPIDINDLSKGVTFSVLDITDRKKAEMALEESEQLFRSLYENSTIGIYRTTPGGKILMANPAAVRMLGFKSFRELSERNLEKVGYEPTYPRNEFKKKLEEKGTVIGLETAWIRKDGKTIYVRESAKAIKDNKGKIIYYDGTFEDITSSKEAERKLQSSEARMRHLLTSTSTVLYSLQIDGQKRIPLWVGDNITQFGYTVEEAKKPDWWLDNIHPDDVEKTNDSFKELKKSNHSIVEYRFKHKEGHYIWIRDEMVLSKGAKGMAEEVIGSWINITKRKLVEEALKESEEKYRSLVENLTDSVFSLDVKGKIKYISPSGYELLGEEPERIISKSLSDFIHPDELQAWQTHFRGVLKGKSEVRDYRFIINNDVHFIRVACQPVAKNESVSGITGILTDVTFQKQTEEEIRKLSLAVEQSPSSVIITDIDGTIEYVNQKLTQVVGYSREELIGKNPRIFKSGETLQRTYQELWSTILAGKTWHGEIKNKTKDGSIILEDIIISPIKDDKGEIKHFVGLREDITKQRTLEEQLRQSQKMEAIGHLAGGVAHDFNNLLTVISGYSDLILRDMDKNNNHFEKLYQIKLSGQRAESLTRQLLAFSRKQIMKPVNLDLNLLISEMEKMLNRIIGEDVDLITIYADDLLNVKADPGQIEQVILNLVVNARDAMPSGGKLIIETKNIVLDEEFVSYHPEVKTGRHVMISVSDNGVGINKDIQSQIFEPFFSTKEKGKGTGLGLSTVYGIVMQSGGYIDVISAPGEGTTFDIYLPAIKKISARADQQSDADIGRGKNETVLLVEDEDTVRKFVIAVLTRYNFNVLAASEPEDALKMVKANKKPIKLLLTDVIMPTMSGKSLADKITKINPKIKIIYMSGYTDDAIVKHGVLDDGIHFIQKPFTPQILINKIKEVLKK